MSDTPSSPNQATDTAKEDKGSSSFQSIFFIEEGARAIRVPDYQRAYSWEQKQVELFINDLVKYHEGSNGYYFGHFIAEDVASDNGWGGWEIVDGQQRITTFVLFLMVCQLHSPTGSHAITYSMIDQFTTVSYDLEAFRAMRANLSAFLGRNRNFKANQPPPDEQLIRDLALKGAFTRSQRKMALALLHFHTAFLNATLETDRIAAYIRAILNAHCSLHLAADKSVAVNIFEMHNTRGVPLTTLEIIKATLMKFVYDHGGSQVDEIQREFGEIYGMEEKLEASTFRGKMTIEQLLRLHLRVVDDGKKLSANEFDIPRMNSGPDVLVEYVTSRLHFTDGDKTKPERPKDDGVRYAINLAKEFKRSMFIISDTLLKWDEENPLVGDVLILERWLSCEFFLVVCRRFLWAKDLASALRLWERLLFTRDFHDAYHGKSYRDNFPLLFHQCGSGEDEIANVINRYLADGFREWDNTKGLQSRVVAFLKENKEKFILNNAFYWWKHKMIYAIYKYETAGNAQLRGVMKGTISVEHILPQEWKWEWIENSPEIRRYLTDDEKEEWLRHVGSFINGIGNLLLLNPSANTALGNNHPAEKDFSRYCVGGSYAEHANNLAKWRNPNQWERLIRDRGECIFRFILEKLVETPETLVLASDNQNPAYKTDVGANETIVHPHQ